MQCVITVKGDGRGKYGHPKTDKTGPLKDFIVDNVVYYIAVTKHLSECNVCSVNDVLTEYLRRRVTIPKFEGFSSRSLVTRVFVLEKLAKRKGEALTQGLVNELIWRGGTNYVITHNARFSLREKYVAFQFQYPSNLSILLEQDRYLAGIVHQSNCGKLSDQELEELVQVAEVMFT